MSPSSPTSRPAPPQAEPQDATHAWTVERLPWWLSGALDADEQLAVEAHLRICDSCRREAEATRSVHAIFARHVDVDELVRYAMGEATSREVRERVRGHLEVCASCREEAALVAADEPTSRLDASSGHLAAVVPLRRPAAGFAARQWTTGRRGLALAAGLVLAVVTAWGVHDARTRPAASSAPATAVAEVASPDQEPGTLASRGRSPRSSAAPVVATAVSPRPVSPDALFSDGFESGSLDVWSARSGTLEVR